ncbi:ABC transporter ATP-binding protein [Miniphocaeibacter massiliensis]|uniref:ABC transporter ATP-binding protein n=1 Tax=Miniphocaeibacter massiliensis TaxID=2041841 RepID=UPI000C078C47|nr:ABC transporter ATP-binding protein [Miniphocaeibacter massiliensis]
MLNISNITVTSGKLVIVDDVSFSLEQNQWLMVTGPNGAGKSTLVKAISQTVPYKGRIFCLGTDASKDKPSVFAKKVGMLVQDNYVNYSFTVEEIVNLGRYAWSKGFFSEMNKNDIEYVENALKITGMYELRKQSVLTLSGGELQRTFLAQVLAQNPNILILDEPTNHLDLMYQKQIFSILTNWVKKENRALISVVHDLSLAKVYGTHALLMKQGKVISQGIIDDVLSNDNLNYVYDMNVSNWMNKLLSKWNDR